MENDGRGPTLPPEVEAKDAGTFIPPEGLELRSCAAGDEAVDAGVEHPEGGVG